MSHRLVPVGVMLLLFSATQSSADCFVLGTFCQEFTQSAAIVDATVESSEAVPAQARRAGLPVVEPYSRVRVRVHRVWKGVEATTAHLEVFASALEHGLQMEPGRRYLLYASRDQQGRLWALGCGRSKPLEEAGMDLAFLAPRLPDARTSTVSGMVHEKDSQLGLRDVEVVLTGTALRSAKTDAAGRFVLADVPNGIYTIRVVTQPPLLAHSPNGARQTLVIRDPRECHEVVFILQRRAGAAAGAGAATR